MMVKSRMAHGPWVIGRKIADSQTSLWFWPMGMCECNITHFRDSLGGEGVFSPYTSFLNEGRMGHQGSRPGSQIVRLHNISRSRRDITKQKASGEYLTIIIVIFTQKNETHDQWVNEWVMGLQSETWSIPVYLSRSIIV